MKSLKTIFYYRKHFVASYTRSSIFCRSGLNPNSSRRFSTAQLSNIGVDALHGHPLSDSRSENFVPNYEPVTNTNFTQRVTNSSDEEEPEPSIGTKTLGPSSRRGDGIENTSESVGKAGLRGRSNCRPMKQFSEGGDSEGSSRGFEISENLVRKWLPNQETEVLRLTDVKRRIKHPDWRLPLPGSFGNEVATVLGGGVVPGSLVLVGGDPGVGKSTMLLQIAAILAEGHGEGELSSVVYVSGEESVEQIGNRADRLNIETENLFLFSSTDIEVIFEKIQHLTLRALIIDSVQTVYLKGVTGSAGGIVQVKECTAALLNFAKKTGIPVFLIGHVTKSGEVAGPRSLEHIVDVVLYLEGEKYSSHRLLRSVKNRFGSTDELGVFEMLPSGLEMVSNPSEMFGRNHDSNSKCLSGRAVAVIMDGTRPFVLEIQALCLQKSYNGKQVNGIGKNKAAMIISVLTKRAGLDLKNLVIFLNAVGGVKLTETAGDLAMAMAICSSFYKFPIPKDIAFIGEIGLGGELRMVGWMEKRINFLAKSGFKRCVVPKLAENCLGLAELCGMKLIGCKNLKDVIDSVGLR